MHYKINDHKLGGLRNNEPSFIFSFDFYGTAISDLHTYTCLPTT